MPHKRLDTPRSNVSCNRTPWHLISSHPRYRSHQCNNELGTRKTKAAPSPHPTFRDNMSDKHLSQAQGPFETFYKSKSRGKLGWQFTWLNKTDVAQRKREKEINDLFYHSTQGFPRIERVFPRTWIAAYISSASRLEWQSNIGEASTYQFIYNWNNGGSVTLKTQTNCTSQKYSIRMSFVFS